ncbi:MAG: S4 domain-containing protein, partial [Clostridia bacterium]
MNEEKTISLIVDAESAEDRLDVYLSDNLQDTTRSHAQRLIFEQQVTVDGLTVTKASRSVKTGENIVVTVPKALPTTILPQNIPINIVYEDECLAVINKRQGMTVHPACGNYTDTLVNALLYQIT